MTSPSLLGDNFSPFFLFWWKEKKKQCTFFWTVTGMHLRSFNISSLIFLSHSLFLLIVFPAHSLTLTFCIILLWFSPLKKNKQTKKQTVDYASAPPEKCESTLILGVMRSVLMEVSLSLDSSVLLSSFSVLLCCIFPKEGVIEQTDRVSRVNEMDGGVNGFSLPSSSPPSLCS